MQPSDMLAAGAVVVRDKGRQVLLVHRPKYDDWSFPKGKLDRGEHLSAAAVREVHEESGVTIRLGRPLPDQRYGLGNGRMKNVSYWIGHPVAGEDVENYPANAEVDEVRWVRWREASALLSYRRDRQILAAAEPYGARTHAVLVLRHAKALPRKEHTGDDRARPLAPLGTEQAAALVDVLAAYGVTRVDSSTSTRCLDTVMPFVQSSGHDLRGHDALSEEGHDADAVAALVAKALRRRASGVLCSHRPVLPDLFAAAGHPEERLAPGELWVAHVADGEVVATERHTP